MSTTAARLTWMPEPSETGPDGALLRLDSEADGQDVGWVVANMSSGRRGGRRRGGWRWTAREAGRGHAVRRGEAKGACFAYALDALAQGEQYRRFRPDLAKEMARLRLAHPGFRTVVFNAEKAGYALVFVDGTQPHEAPRAFAALRAACAGLACMSEIEWITAGDALWQVQPAVVQPAEVVEQYRHVQDDETWHFWMRRTLRAARYYMRQDIYSRTVYGSHRPGYGKRLVDDAGAVVDEWVDPIEPMILRVLRAKGNPVSLEPLCDTMEQIAGFHDGYYIWDVLHACGRLVQKGALRRVNPKASNGDERFVLAATGATT